MKRTAFLLPWNTEIGEPPHQEFLFTKYSKYETTHIIYDNKLRQTKVINDNNILKEYGFKKYPWFSNDSSHINLQNRYKHTNWYVNIAIVDDALVYRFLNESVITYRNKETGKYDVCHKPLDEYYRIVIRGGKLYKETRDDMFEYPAGALLKTFYVNASTLCTKPLLFVDANGCVTETMCMINYIDNPDNCISSYLENVDLGIPDYDFCDVMCMMRIIPKMALLQRKQHFYKSVPKEVVKDVESLSHKAADFPTEKTLSGYQYAIFMYVDTAVYFGEKMAYAFHYNKITRKWSSYPLNRAFDGALRCSATQVFFGDFKKGVECVKNLNDQCDGIYISDIYYATKYVAYEQVCKMGLKNIRNLVWAEIRAGNCSKRESITELFGISGKQLRLLDKKIKGLHWGKDVCEKFKKTLSDQQIKNAYPDLESRIFAASFYCIANAYETRGKISRKDIAAAARTLSALSRSFQKNRDIDEREIAKRIYEYEDYLKARPAAIRKTGRPDLFPISIKSSRINEYHGRAIRYQYANIEDAKKYGAKISEIKKKESRLYEFEDKNYQVILPKDGFDIIDEGANLCHCVGTNGYIERMGQDKCRIAFLRRKNAPNKSLITMEIRLTPHGDSIMQCFGAHDSYNKDKDIARFIERYADEKRISINTIILKQESIQTPFPFGNYQAM